MFQTFQLFLTKLPYMFQTFNFFKFEQLKFEQLISFLYEIVNCSNCYCSTFRADNNIIDICSNLVNPFGKVDSSSFIYLFICSNGVEQSRVWCRAVFSCRWISSSWPFSNKIFFKMTLLLNHVQWWTWCKIQNAYLKNDKCECY